MVPSLPLLSCESSVSVKENPDRKKKKNTEYLSVFSLNAGKYGPEKLRLTQWQCFNWIHFINWIQQQETFERKMISNKVIPGNGGSSNPALSLCETVVKVLTIITNCSILGVWQRCEYVSAFGTNQSFWYIF